MPIRPDLLPLYRTPEYKAARASLVERAGNKCEQCGKPNGEVVETVTGFTDRPRMYWRSVGPWFDHMGRGVESIGDTPHRVKVVCTFAHLDHNPANNAEDNKAFLCQWCHLHYDGPHHKYSRSVRKDRGRPLLGIADESRT
jgi:hypothetical protein